MNKSGRFKAILFDFGNVLVNFDHWIAVKRVAHFSSLKPQEIFELFFDSSLTAAFEEGRISGEEFFSELKKALRLKLGYEEFLPIWNDIFFLTDSNLMVHKLIKGLKENYPCLLISNINKVHFDYIRKRFPSSLEGFKKMILSYEVGTRKPDPLIYEKALMEAGVAGSEVIYTDDRQDLIEAAKRLGITAIQFKEAELFRKELLKLGVNLG